MEFDFYNPSKVLLYIDELRKSEIVSLDIHPSGSCNQECVWCRYPKSNEQLTLKTLRLKEKYPKLRGVRVTGGGEPTLNKGLPDALRLWRQQGLEIGIETNGVLIDEGLAEAIANNCRYCRVSLDAATPETYNRLHRRDDWMKVMTALTILNDAGVKELGISYLVVEENCREIPLLLNLPIQPTYLHFRPLIGSVSLPVSIKAADVINRELMARTTIPIKYDRLLADLYAVPSIPCRITRITRVLGADGKEYVCCEHAYEDGFAVGIWNGDSRDCTSCRYAEYNKILHLFESGRLSEGLL